jgi:16S rRNA (cytidine1402-2'-O)-methyltransferase
LLKEGKSLALVTDAGTPAISDPGAFLVRRIRDAIAADELPEIKIIPIPGASAVVSALSVAGLSKKEFLFLGFPPHKKGRKTFFEKVAQSVAVADKTPVVFYESKHRIVRALESLIENCPNARVVVCRELTKMFEETFTGSAEEILGEIQSDPKKQKGEFVVIVE